MKHYNITKTNNGWTKASITRADGTVQTYGQFYDEKEATIWAYARLRHEYGKEIAEKELGKKLK